MEKKRVRRVWAGREGKRRGSSGQYKRKEGREMKRRQKEGRERLWINKDIGRIGKIKE